MEKDFDCGIIVNYKNRMAFTNLLESGIIVKIVQTDI
jgi:hypothetical protein